LSLGAVFENGSNGRDEATVSKMMLDSLPGTLPDTRISPFKPGSGRGMMFSVRVSFDCLLLC
jgi:hypothetical protein